MLQLQPIQLSEQAQLRSMAEAYWQEIMPTADVVQDWEAQGFRVAHYFMRQYRDPQSGQLFIGAVSSDFNSTIESAFTHRFPS